MMQLTRKESEAISIGSTITVTVLEIKGQRVTLAIDAPDNDVVLHIELRSGDDTPNFKSPQQDVVGACSDSFTVAVHDPER